LPDDVVRVREYPLSSFFSGFDIGFMASGYNSFHEALSFGLPTMFIPNLSTNLDDQGARARYASVSQTGVAWDGHDADSLARGMEALTSDASLGAMRSRMAELRPAVGAAEAAAAIRQWGTIG
jgi:UDP:flavonoid glycosyltransferase YjiC (YdhE family)